MLSFLQENRKIIFRLLAALYLVYLINPGQYWTKQGSPVPEHGIGGGDKTEEVITGAEAGILMTPASLESVVLEPEVFLKSRILFYNPHIVENGENISGLGIDFGLNQDTIISVNKITNSRLLQIGKVLRIPNQDGILHTVSSGETLSSIAEKYSAKMEAIKTANELFSDKVAVGTELFIPGARLDWSKMQEINGDLFIWPLSGAITSSYGYRRNPFNRSRSQFHSGIDIRGSMGAPIKAAMAGRVSMVGYDNVFGNYVIINHHSGYRTLYGHMSRIRTRTGAYVAMGERIGDVGSTGQSTGPHLHFTVYKNGVTVNPRPLIR
jgi:LysM repeat protein